MTNQTLNDFNIHFEGSDESVSSLIMRYDDGDLIIDIDYQRGDVWDLRRASKLIESVSLNLPLPIFYTFETQQQSELIDGKQRFLSLLKFINGEYKLLGLKELKNLNGKRFKDLTREEQRVIKNHKLHIFTTKADSEEAKYEIFERLNTGGAVLKSQEIILGLNEGKVADFAKKVSERLIDEGIEKINSNKHKQIDAKVLCSMFFFKEKASSPIASSRNRILHEVLTNPDYQNQVNDTFLNEIVTVMTAAKASALRVSDLVIKDRGKSRLNQSMFETLICVYSKMAKEITNTQPEVLVNILKPIEKVFAHEILKSEDNLLAYSYSTNGKLARAVKTKIAHELNKLSVSF